MTRPRGSVARQSFADARAVLAGHELSSPGVRPAIDFDAEPIVTDLPWPGSRVAAGAATGPMHRALAGLTSGTISAREVVAASLDRLALATELGAVAEIDADAALARATELDDGFARGEPCGPLHGVPITVKDVIDVAGFCTRAGSEAYEDRPAVDATAIALLREAGAVILGKVATHEFALGVTSPTTSNPVDPTRLAGGSSGGSAVAVAIGMGLASIGTDTRASIRTPAALSGVVGFKATYGRVPTDGIVSLSWTMDHVAPMASSVADAALVVEVLAPGVGSLRTAAGAGVAGVRVGVPLDTFAGADPAVAKGIDGALDRLRAAGAHVVEVAHPDASDLALASGAGLIVSRCEAAAVHRSMGLDRDRYWQEVAEQLDEAEQVSAVDYLDAQRARRDLRTRLGSVFDSVDVLMMPTSPVVAPPAEDFAEYLILLARNAIPWSFTGFPAASVPCGLVDGLPVGMQIVAPPGREDRLVSAGVALEQL